MAEGDSSINVGGVNFEIGIDLASFEKNLQRAEILAKEHAARIQQILGNIQTNGGTGSSDFGGGGGSVSQRPPVIAPNLGIPRTVDVNQTVNVRRDFREVNSAAGRIIGRAADAMRMTGGLPPRQATAEEIAAIVAGGRGPQRTLTDSEVQAITTRPSGGSEGGYPTAPGVLTPGGAIREARYQGNAFSQISSMNQIGLLPDEKIAAQDEALEKRFGPQMRQAITEMRAANMPSAGYSTDDDARSAISRLRVPVSKESLAQERAARAAGQAADDEENGRINVQAARGSGRGGRGGGYGGGSGGGGGGGPFEFLFGNTGEAQSRSLLRFGAGLAGFGIGINLAAGAARLLHDSLVAIGEEALHLEQAGRDVGIAFGGTASNFTGRGAAGFAANQGTRGSSTEYLQTAASVAPIAQQYKLTNDQVQKLIISEGQLARIHGVDLPQAAQVLNQVLRGNLEAGQSLDLVLTDQYGIIKNVGLTYQQLVQAVGPAAATSTILAQAQKEISTQTENASRNIDETASAMDRFGKAGDALKTSLANLAKTPVTFAINIATFAVGGGLPPVTGSSHAPQTEADVQGRLILGPAGERQQKADLEKVRSEQARLAGINAAMNAGLNNSDANGGSQAIRDAAGYQGLGIMPEQGAQTPSELKAKQNQAEGARLADQNRILGIQQSGQQATISILDAQAKSRQLDVAAQLNQYASTRIDLENELAPLLLRQQAIQDRITLTTRENLDLTQARLEAQRAEAITGSALEQNNYQQNIALLRAQSAISSIVRGQAPKYDIGSQIGQIRTAAFAAPDVKIADAEAQHALNLTTVAQNVDQISKAIAVIPLEREQQVLQAEVLMRQEELAAATASTEVINRMLEVASIMAAPERLQAERDLNNTMISAAKAAQELANMQLQQNADSANPVIVNVNIGSIGAGGVTPDAAAWIDQITNATRGGALDAINSKANLTLPRAPSNTPGARY